ncbi:MAG: hypothetical protein PHP70_03125 [Gallionella sp.]|nr:hypothetical protein [Gallionella sp.]
MKKSNVILQTAIASALLAMAGTASAQAGLTTTTVAFATEQFTGTSPKTSHVVQNLVVKPGTTIPLNSNVTVAIALTGGTWTAVPTGNTGALSTTSSVSVNASASSVLILNMGLISAVGVGGTLATISMPSINYTGTSVTGTATIYVGDTVDSATMATATVFDATSAAQSIATYSPGVTLAATANTTASKIDLTATTPSIVFTAVSTSVADIDTNSTTTYKLGTLTITDNAKKIWHSPGTNYTTAVSAPNITATIAAPAGFFAALGTTGVITLEDASAINACAAPTASATSVAYTVAASAAAATSVAVTGSAMAGHTSGQAYDVCMTVNGTTAMTTGTPTIAVTLGSALSSPSNSVTLAATNLQALDSNGSTFNVRNYVPAAATGYSTFVRVINTGSLSAAVSVALVDETTGTAGTAGTLATLAAGAARNFTPAEIEAVTGAVASTARPRLRITAPTNTMDVQTFLVQPNGTVSDMTGAQ